MEINDQKAKLLGFPPRSFSEKSEIIRRFAMFLSFSFALNLIAESFKANTRKMEQFEKKKKRAKVEIEEM